jgi:hypothetical protein
MRCKFFYSFFYTLLLTLLVGSCVPIEDRFDPIISPFAIEDLYFLSDTIYITANVTDNAGLDRVEVEIRPRERGAVGWQELVVVENIRSRRYLIDTFFVVPVDAELRPYELSITATDLSGRIVNARRLFNLMGDTRAPRFLGVEISNLEADAQGVYEACRLNTLLLRGYVKDNVGITEVRAQLDNFPPVVRVVNGQDSVSLAELFTDRLIIPDAVTNGTLLRLRIQAKDTDNNIATLPDLLIRVDCDDVVPTLEVRRTNPEVGNNNTVNIIEGRYFDIVDAIANDEVGRLDSLFIFLNRVNASPNLIQSLSLNGQEGETIALQTLFDQNRIRIQLPADARVGERFLLTLQVKDRAGNLSTPYQVTILVTKDQPPVITLSNIFILENQRVVQNITNFNQEISLRSTQTVRIEGKILDDVGITQIEVRWGHAGAEEQIFVLQADELGIGDEFPTVIDFSDERFIKNYAPESNLSAPTRYQLIISTQDTQDQLTRSTLRFLIEP